MPRSAAFFLQRPHHQFDQALFSLFELLSSTPGSIPLTIQDLQSTLEPQDSRFPFLERANSDNDQRHRWGHQRRLSNPRGTLRR